MIKDQFPWLWAMKDLIDERPNFIPPETSNNQLVVDMAEYMPSNGFDSTGDEVFTWGNIDEPDIDREVEDKEPSPVPSIPTKRKVEHSEPEKKTSARPGISVPVAQVETKKPRNALDKFTESLKAEEITVQRQIELKRARIDTEKETQVARIQAQARVRISKYKMHSENKAMQLQLEEKRMMLQHEYRMAQLASASGQALRSGDSHRQPEMNTIPITHPFPSILDNPPSTSSSGFGSPSTSSSDLVYGSGDGMFNFHSVPDAH